MGRHKKHANWKGKKKPSQNPNPSTGYETIHFATENKAFEAYYKFALKQEFANESEWTDFMNILRVKLPVVFRINDNVPNYQNFLDKLKTPSYISKLLTAETAKPQPETLEKAPESEPAKEVEEKKVLDQLSLKNIPWYPNEQVWQLNTFRHELKKNKAYQNLHKFITRATEAGLISRQELVSMLPPLLLDVKSTDIILDMCAAPGSKTAQLLELLYKDETLGKGPTQGCVLANDIDYRRAAMLIHQVQRISTTGMMVVSHSGQHFPTLKKPADGEGDRQFYFDKVLADVPCSGDGAIRKLPDKWGKWSVRDGIVLHPLQVQIAIRAVQLAKVGGYILYSTCSINPVEDEAVVVELFRRCKNDALEIVDIREKLPGLITRPGMLNWSVCDEKAPQEPKENIPSEKTAQEYFNIYQSFDQLPENYQGNIKASMFPESLEKMRDEIKIQNTIRIMPHDQNTGGFYLALLRKKDHAVFNSKDAKNQKEEEPENLEEKDKAAVLEAQGKTSEDAAEGEAPKEAVEEEEKKVDTAEKPVVKKKVRRGDPPLKKPVFEKFDTEEWDWIKEFYGITDDSVKDLFIQQNEGDRKVLMVSPGVKKILDLDKEKGGLNKLNMGAKVMHRNREVFLDNKHPWRVTQDALSALLPYMTKKTIKCSASDFIYMIQKLNVTLADLPSDDLRQKIANEGKGCFILECENDGPIKDKESLSCLSLPNSVSVMVSAELVESLKLRYMDTVSEQQK